MHTLTDVAGETLRFALSGNGQAPALLRTIDLARAAGLSLTLVRTYERLGFLPPVPRSPTGYRRYTREHADALRVSRCLIAGFGWQPALEAMRAVHRGDVAHAIAVTHAAHATLQRQHSQLERTLLALDEVLQLPAPAVPARGLRIGEAARQAGVRPSALRFWERQGLLVPSREASTDYRIYDAHQLRRVHVIALLRAVGHDADSLRSVLDDLSAGHPDRARRALQERRASLHDASLCCLRATAELTAYLDGE
jgi:DNA-binding transcriptional MerR regulator